MIELLGLAYVVIGLVHANNRVNNPNPALRPLWASDRSLPGPLRFLGFLVIAAIWPISILAR